MFIVKDSAIPVSKVLYVKSDRHWLCICHQSGKEVVRGTLKAVEDKYSDKFIKIKRGLIVAFDAIERLCGSGETYYLHLRKLDEPLLVSRRALPSVKQALGEN